MTKEADASDNAPKKIISRGLIFAAGVLVGGWGVTLFYWLKRDSDKVHGIEAGDAPMNYIGRPQRFVDEDERFVEETEALAEAPPDRGPGAGH